MARRSRHAHRTAVPRWLLPAAGIAGLGGLAYWFMKKSAAPTSSASPTGTAPPGTLATNAEGTVGIGQAIPFSAAPVSPLGACNSGDGSNYVAMINDLARRATANPFALGLLEDVDRMINTMSGIYVQVHTPGGILWSTSHCDDQVAYLQNLRAQILAARGVGSSGIGPLFGPGSTGTPGTVTPFAPPAPTHPVHGAPIRVPSSFSPQTRPPSIVVRSFPVGTTPQAPVAPAPAAPSSPVFVPTRGGGAGAGAARRIFGPSGPLGSHPVR
jgi:hypothetical protein